MVFARSFFCRRWGAACGAVLLMGLGAGCIGSSSGSGAASANGSGDNPAADGNAAPQGQSDSSALTALRKFPLGDLRTSTVTITDNEFRVWLALDDAQSQEGLMYVPQGAIADDQGMLFVFDREDFRSFWMKNTITPLDIAFIRSDGTIVKIHTMPALTLQTFPSVQPARFALEVKAGTFSQLGIRPGDHVDIPAEIFKTTP